eukprot:TRINITY_DN4086_c0_g1_i1.p1 TRINITY_DN4086_c0_g1~~TRINITY_DN4086_c0_g1_i1.p1  ORF type:complete len:238 (-),score=58.57 TRINITY_DN4086_c0_g1_i1:651-1364(-)
MKAIVIGGSGAVGRFVVKELFQSSNFSSVTVLARRPYGYPGVDTKSSKLREVIIDFERLADYSHEFEGQDVFVSALGTTRKQSPSKEAYFRVDNGYPMLAAELAKKAGVRQMAVVTTVGADANSWLEYGRRKGQLEDHLKSLKFDRLSIFRPAGLLGDRSDQDRPWYDRIILPTVAALNFLIPQRWSGTQVSDVALAMRVALERPIDQVGTTEIYEVADLQRLAAAAKRGAQHKDEL